MQVYNTLSGQKERFIPGGDVVKMYVCGVTPYSETHLGHAMSNIIFDVVRRYLQFRNYRVRYVQNVTDVDDKIIERAAERGVAPDQLAREYTRRFFEEMERLNVLPADAYPRATEEIPAIINMIDGLMRKGHAYESMGSVYFRVRSVPDYGKLSHRSVESMITDRSEQWEEMKEHPLDFALWKAAKAGEPAWDSPWGPGRPGWHIECSAMSLSTLGETLDIHGGGLDLVFPHHENEIAQSESYTGIRPFVRYWLHNGLLQFGREKMSKSLGNLVTVTEALDRVSPDALRIFVLSSHYRSPLTYSEEALQAAEKNAERLRQVMAQESATDAGERSFDVTGNRERFIEAMDDDFNTPRALVVLYDLAKEINRDRQVGGSGARGRSMLRELSNVLGLTLNPIAQVTPDAALVARLASTALGYAGGHVSHATDPGEFERAIDRLIAFRAELRKSRQWQRADALRKELEDAGVVLEDNPHGTTWRMKSRVLAEGQR